MRVTTHAQQALVGAVVLLLAACVVFTASTAEAAINKQLYFQGILKDSNGTAVADDAYDMVFSIYTNATGTTPLWTGTHTAANGNEVNVKSGVFGILLGSGAGNALNLDFNTDELYLGITVESDSEMIPRQRIGAAPYAFNADTVDGVGFATSTLSTGDMLYFNGADLERLGIGTNDQILTLVGGLPTWANKSAQLFATTSDSSALYPTDTSQTLIIGGSATTTQSMFEVYGDTFLGGDVAVSENASISGTLTLGGALDIGSEQFTDLTGSGLALVSGALTVATSTFRLNPSVIDLATGNILVGDGSGNASETGALFISSGGNIGIGTTTPTAMLSVNGSVQLAGSSRYLNFGGGVDAAGYGLRDHSGALQYKDSGGSWRTLGGPLEYDAGTGQYNVSLAQYVDSLDASVQEDAIRGIAFNNDGTKFYTVGQNSGNVNEYNLSPAYDISTATLVDSVSVTAQDAAPFGMAFNDTGTKLYIIGIIDSEINEYDLSPAYDTSTATFVDTLSLSAASVSPTGMAFNDTGTKLYVIDSTTDTINEYALSPAFDVSTAVFTDGLDVGAQETRPEGVTFNNEGTKLYVTGWGGDDVNEYDLSPAYDVSTASFVHRYIVSAQNNNPGDVVFNNDGTRFYVSSNIGGFVYEYRIPIIGRTYITNTSSYFGIGITEPLDPLHVAGNIRVGTGTTGCVKDANGTVISGTCSSDRKLKTDILPLGRASSTATAGLNAGSASTTRSLLDAFVALEPVTYRWNDLAASTFHHGTDELQTGLIAQQVRETLPELVSESSDGYLQIHFSDLPIYTIQALKELNTKVESIAVRSGIDMSGDLHGLRTYASAQFETLDAEVFTVGTADKPSGITLYDEDTNEPYCLRIKSGTLVYTSGACASNPPVDNAPKQEQPEPTEHTPPPPAPAPDESSEQPEDSEKTEADEAAPAGEQHDAAPETTDADTLSPESDQNETVQEPSEPIQSQTPPQTQPTTQQESEEVQPTQPLPEPQPEPEPEPQPDSQPDPAPDPENS